MIADPLLSERIDDIEFFHITAAVHMRGCIANNPCVANLEMHSILMGA